jgi:hypothetical protein
VAASAQEPVVRPSPQPGTHGVARWITSVMLGSPIFSLIRRRCPDFPRRPGCRCATPVGVPFARRDDVNPEVAARKQPAVSPQVDAAVPVKPWTDEADHPPAVVGEVPKPRLNGQVIVLDGNLHKVLEAEAVVVQDLQFVV